MFIHRCIFFFFFFNDTATTEIYTVSDTLSLHDALPIRGADARRTLRLLNPGRKASTHRSEEHTFELQSPDTISYAVFCLKKKNKKNTKKIFTFYIIQKKNTQTKNK